LSRHIMQIPTHNLEANTILGVTAHLVDFVHRSQTRTTAAMDLFLGSTPGAPRCLCLIARCKLPVAANTFVCAYLFLVVASLAAFLRNRVTRSDGFRFLLFSFPGRSLRPKNLGNTRFSRVCLISCLPEKGAPGGSVFLRPLPPRPARIPRQNPDYTHHVRVGRIRQHSLNQHRYQSIFTIFCCCSAFKRA
jgi:hypothetical protein